MDIKELKNMTASCGTGEKGNKTYHRILRGNLGDYGVELHIDLDAIETAVKAGAYTFVSKKTGHKILKIYPKIWEGKEQGENKPDLNDEIPF